MKYIANTLFVVVLAFAVAACGEKAKGSPFPAERVAHMTVTQHTPDTIYRLEYTFVWHDMLLEGIGCLLPDGRTERLECRYDGTILEETAVYAADGRLHERWTYHYAGESLVGQTLTMEGYTVECTFRYEGSRPVGISYRRPAADGRVHAYEHRLVWQGDNVAEETVMEDGAPVQRTAFRYGGVHNPLRLSLGIELATCWSLTRTGMMGEYYHLLPMRYADGCPVEAVCNEGTSFTAEYVCDAQGRPSIATLKHGDICTEIRFSYWNSPE